MNQSISEILERVSDAFVTLDAQWRYTYVNARAAALFGRSPEELLGKNIWQEYPEGVDQPFAQAFRRAMREQTPMRIEAYYQPWDRWFENRIFPSPGGLGVFFTDITDRKRTELALQESEARFRTLVETSPEAIGIAVEGRLAYANPAMVRLLGASSPADLLGGSVLSWVHPAEHVRVRERLQRMLAGKSVEPDVQRWVRLDGEEVLVEVVSSPTIYQGRPAHQALARDVTEQMHAREQLRRQEAYFRALTECSTDLVTVLEADGTIRYQNPAAARVLGYSEQELTGVNAFSLMHPDDLPVVREQFLLMLDCPGEGVPVCFRFRHADGSWRFLEAEGRNLLEDDSVRGVVINSRDVTLRVEAESRLRESEERYRLVTRATNDVIWDYDLVAERVYWSESLTSAFGYDPAEEKLELGWWEERIHPEDRPRVLSGLDEAIDRGASVWSDEYRFRCRDGRYAVVFDRGLLRRDENGRPMRMIGIMQDLTAKREAETELHALFSAMQDVILVIDRDGRYRKIAPSSPDLLVRPSEEMIGRTFHEILPPEQADFFLRSVRASLDDDRTIGIEYSMDIGGREMWFAATLSPMNRETVVWVARDITERRRSEEALRSSERLYREIFEQSRDTIYIQRVDGSLVDVNPAAEEVFGAPRDELLRHDVGDFYVSPADRERLEREVAARGSIRNYEVRLRRLNGGEFDALISTTALRSDDGRPVGYQGTIHDITERKEAERRLQAQEARFRSMIENVHDVICVIDPDGLVRYISPSVERLLGRPADQFLGSSAFAWFHPDDRDVMEAAIREDLARPGASRTLELRAQHRNGTWKRLEVVSLNLLKDPSVAGMILTGRNITERSEAKEALQRSEAWFRSLTQNALDITTVVDVDGRIRYATPSGARTLGYSKEDLAGRTLLDLIHPEDRPQVAAALERLVREGTEPVNLTARIRARDETWQVHQSVAQSLLHDPSVQGIVINSRDVTQQRRLEAELRQAQKMEAVGRLAGGVAHDFNNVLMSITGFAALLEAEIPPGSDAAQFLTEIHKSADRAASLTRQLLAFGRKQALRPKVVNLNSVVEGAGGMLRRLIREDVELIYRLHPLLGQCRVDPHQVEQVLINLVVNATDALPEGGVIEIATRNRVITERDRRVHSYVQPGSYTALSVRDTGYGMDADILAKIFEPFFTTKEVGKGTGLGLSTVYGIVKQSGGYITVESRPGEGSTFTVLLPRVSEAESPSDPRLQAPLRAGSGTVLLAEDEDAVRLLARLTLQKAGYKVLEARDGDEALRVAREHAGGIDLLLTDVVMPRLGGYALARKLREQWPALPVIYISGYPGDASRDATPLPADTEFLVKPVTPEALTHRVREVLTAK